MNLSCEEHKKLGNEYLFPIVNLNNMILVFVDAEIWQGPLTITEVGRRRSDKEDEKFRLEATTLDVRM
jgi:hypothetical protein